MQWEQTVYWCALFTFIIRDFFRFVKSVFARQLRITYTYSCEKQHKLWFDIFLVV